MSFVHTFWKLDLRGTTQTSDPQLMGVLNLFVRHHHVFRNGNRTTSYEYPIEVARASVVLPRALLQSTANSYVYMEYVLARFGIDRRYLSSFVMRILRATRGLSGLYPRGFRMTAVLDQTVVENAEEVEDSMMPDVMEQLDSELATMRGASKSAILGLKEKVYAAEDGECCSICLEDFQMAEKVTELPCSHVFHRRCIIRWLENKNSCPLCRCQLDA